MTRQLSEPSSPRSHVFEKEFLRYGIGCVPNVSKLIRLKTSSWKLLKLQLFWRHDVIFICDVTKWGMTSYLFPLQSGAGPESAVSVVSRYKAGRVGLQAVLGELSNVKRTILINIAKHVIM